jgi:hypothetical protein
MTKALNVFLPGKFARVRAIATLPLRVQPSSGHPFSSNIAFSIAAIARFLENLTEVELSPPAVMPDGSPI